ncbi:hypothetical protein FC40_GL000364 [Ligilactobacillus hayakitensis DSM 18933 = JCM 14209]|uniref:Acyltransferase 3 domain-containing protein n=1 Tax=Ligilactobacillus hayakitensis DSM 18933 = JCM 14209 TaxID=1423755 RepID=A0A0R1X175_9LACO|nr:acyltransferase [Ligilactobacillus hayakitensis]KRM20124.1 hypothetical protein FC40_GL000364 [Ligilactobacillus hayakitensis DSM 18933 = JCM 14209]
MDKGRNYGIDFLKIIACLAVLRLHIISINVAENEFQLFTYYLSGFAVPIFFMANGYFILNKRDLKFDYIIKKIKKILILLVIWNTIYWIKNIITNNEINISGWLLGSVLTSKNIGAYHLWFFWALIFTLICDYYIYKLDKMGFKYGYTVGLLSILNIVAYAIHLDSSLSQVFRVYIWLFYSIIGGFLGKIKIDVKSKRNVNLFCLMLIFIVTEYIYINYNLSLPKPRLAEFNYDFWIFMISTISLFIILSSIGYNLIIANLIEKIVSLTMGVYVIHIGVLWLVEKFTQNLEIRYIVTLVVSFLIVYILSKLKWINKIVSF